MKFELWHPAPYDKADVVAIQAVQAGTASADQQKRALDWIIMRAAITYENGFRPDDPNGRLGANVDGRQYVGQQIIKLLKMDPNKIGDETA